MPEHRKTLALMVLAGHGAIIFLAAQALIDGMVEQDLSAEGFWVVGWLLGGSGIGVALSYFALIYSGIGAGHEQLFVTYHRNAMFAFGFMILMGVLWSWLEASDLANCGSVLLCSQIWNQ